MFSEEVPKMFSRKMFGRKMFGRRLFVPASLALSATSAMAAVNVDAITGMSADVSSVGLAVFGILVAVKAVKMLRRAL